MSVIHPTGTMVTLTVIAAAVYVRTGIAEPYFSFRSEEALVAIVAPTGVLVSFVFWSLTVAFGAWRNSVSRWWLLAVAVGTPMMGQLCYFPIVEYLNSLEGCICEE